MLPVKLDIESLDRELAALLAQLEGRLRNFEAGDRPAYDHWIRVELGPDFSVLDELAEKIHARRILAHRVNSLVQNEGLNPREALFVAMAQPNDDANDDSEVDAENDAGDDAREKTPGDEKRKNRPGFDADEIEARRRAKVESKRARRKEEKREKAREKKAEQPEDASRNRLVSIYRSLARKLHPDSPLALKDLTSQESLALWHEVQSAYDGANLDRLLSIAAWLGTQGERSKEILSSSERMERLRAMKKSIRKLEMTLQQLSNHVAWEFRKKVGSERKKLRKKAAREIEDEIARTQEVLDMLDDFIEAIGQPKAPKGDRKSKRRS